MRCPSCPRLTGSGEDADTETFNEQRLLDRIERLRRQRDSGRPIAPLVDAGEWELLMIYDEHHDTFKRSHELRVAQMFEILNALLLKR